MCSDCTFSDPLFNKSFNKRKRKASKEIGSIEANDRTKRLGRLPRREGKRSSDVCRKNGLICRNAENRRCLASRNRERVHPSRCIKFISSDPVDFSRCTGHRRERCHVPRILVCYVGFILRLMPFGHTYRRALRVAKKQSRSRSRFEKIAVWLRYSRL